MKLETWQCPGDFSKSNPANPVHHVEKTGHPVNGSVAQSVNRSKMLEVKKRTTAINLSGISYISLVFENPNSNNQDNLGSFPRKRQRTSIKRSPEEIEMPLQSNGACPSCGAGIDMKKREGVFTCPVCGCAFRHNWRAWLVGIPLAIVVAYGVFLLLHVGTFSAIAGAVVAIGIVSRMGLYRVLEEGKPDVTEAEFLANKPEKKESTWVIVFLAVLLLAIAAGAFFL